jgi:hypothetical protein
MFPAGRMWPGQYPWWYGAPYYPAPLPVQTCHPTYTTCTSSLFGGLNTQGTCCPGNQCTARGIDQVTARYVGTCTPVLL